jgi:hypothetical protein
MDVIAVKTDLNRFIMLDSIEQATDISIKGVKRFSNSSVYQGLEALAQLGALHVRYKTDFNCHAFLLSIKTCSIDSDKPLNGNFKLSGILQHHSREAFSYKLTAKKNSQIILDGTFIIATIKYDDVFTATTLRTHYKKLFMNLTDIGELSGNY